MRTILSGVAILSGLLTAAPAAFAASEGPMTLAQSGGVSSFNREDRRHRPQRYVCVVPPRQSDDRNRPYVCRADAGRVGGTCRCDNVTGTGRLDLDD